MDDPMDQPFSFEDFDDEKIEERKNQLARRRALLDQCKKRFEDQYPLCHPSTNQARLHDIEAREFRLEMNEWELDQFISFKENTDR